MLKKTQQKSEMKNQVSRKKLQPNGFSNKDLLAQRYHTNAISLKLVVGAIIKKSWKFY